jgi:hypothetical protein
MEESMNLSEQEINQAMGVYLGAEGVGYNPLRKEERLEKKYGSNWKDVLTILNHYLDWVGKIEVDWKKESLDEAIAKVNRLVQEKYPWFDDNTRMKIANFFGYQWK